MYLTVLGRNHPNFVQKIGEKKHLKNLFDLNVSTLATFPKNASNEAPYKLANGTTCATAPKNITVDCFSFWGFEKLTSKGGFSVGNIITLNFTITVPCNFSSDLGELYAISIQPYGAMQTPLTLNRTLGIYNFVHIVLNKSKTQVISWGTTWTGSVQTVYSSSGTFGGIMKQWIDLNSSYRVHTERLNCTIPQITIISGPNVSAQSLTNSLATSLTLAILALTIFSLRSEDKGYQCKYQETGNNPVKPDQPRPRQKKYK